jgi:hypothetical protein
MAFECNFATGFRNGFKTPSKAESLRCAPSQNAHPPQADCAFSSTRALTFGAI